MKKLLLVLLMFVSTFAFADTKRLSNGSVAMWNDCTSVIKWNSYRVEITLSEECDFNVYGTIYIRGGHSGDRHQGNFIIEAGDKKGYVDFEGLENDTRYYITVKIRN